MGSWCCPLRRGCLPNRNDRMNRGTPQEDFWAGEFGDSYSDRNVGREWVSRNIALFTRVLRATAEVDSILEVGANIGLNLQALAHLLPNASLTALEINSKAVESLRKLERVEAHHASLLEFSPRRTWDLVLSKGVLIHIQPAELPIAYDCIHKASDRYVALCEYYSPTPVAITYRGHEDRLFKRDFAGEMLDRFDDLRLVDYGFAYHRDPNFPQDDLNWFLLEKCRRAM